MGWLSWQVALIGSAFLFGTILTVCLTLLKLRGGKVKAGNVEVTVGDTDGAAMFQDANIPAQSTTTTSASSGDASSAPVEVIHLCQHTDDFQHFARMLEAMANLLSGLADHAVNSGANGPVIEAKTVLDVRLKDYREHLDARGLAG